MEKGGEVSLDDYRHHGDVKASNQNSNKCLAWDTTQRIQDAPKEET